VKNLCLFQVFNWEVKDAGPATVQLFTDFYAVCKLIAVCCSKLFYFDKSQFISLS